MSSNGPWFRCYADIYRNKKLRRLRPDLQLLFLWLLALRKEDQLDWQDEDGIAFLLRINVGKLRAGRTALYDVDLLDKNGQPVGWKERQFESDVSTPRVKRFRERSMKQDETVSETAPDTDSETDADSETDISAKPRRTRSAPVDDSPVIGTIQLADGSDFAITEKMAEPWRPAYPGCDIAREIAKARAWCLANPTKRKTRRGAMKFMVGWLERSQNSGRPGASGRLDWTQHIRQGPSAPLPPEEPINISDEERARIADEVAEVCRRLEKGA